MLALRNLTRLVTATATRHATIGSGSVTRITPRFLCSRPSERLHGQVKWFNEKRGYGFVLADDGSEFFVHYSEINGVGFKTLRDGERVDFEVKTGPNGRPQCSDVVVQGA
eukprot:TRINITY_DN5616_c0_g1_i1.p1 TRINITY_DN5616_c0_g1~~TRINITY_DN5616_c0_g1_i1.p1  ORF type:complete len:110 (+),score=26.74 TRINITY_DN5616_c0_g1_i1:57-386(+)